MGAIYSDLPLWTLVFWAVFVVAISLFFYRKKSWIKEISKGRRILLIFLRSLGLFLLGVLLLGVLFRGTEKEVDRPKIITIIDDSQSMLNYSDSTEVREQTKQFLHSISSDFQAKYTPVFYSLDNEIETIDSLNFDNNKTNISQALNKVYESYYGRNIGAVILLSDGNFNAGSTPLLVAEKFKRTPIYTLSVGDTIQKVDHLIKTVFTNEVSFLGNKFPVEVTIEGNKTGNSSFNLELWEDGKLLETKTLQHQDSDYSLIKTEFVLEATSVGIHEYTVKAQVLEHEFNVENNAKSFFIEVLDDRSKILLISEVLNPDVGAVRSALISENNLEIKNTDISDLPEKLEDFDLIIWFDPGAGQNTEAFQKIIAVNKPIWYFVTPQTSHQAMSQLQLQANIQTTGRSDNVGAAFNPEFNLFKLSAENRKAIDNFPPLKSHFGTIRFNPSNAILAYQKLGNIVKQEPVFYFGEKQNKKFAVTYGIGLWGWRIADFQLHQSHRNFNEIVRKSVQYLILRENTSRLRVHLPTIAGSEEDFVLKAEFYNESYEPITEPTIHLELKNAAGESFDYSFLPLDKEYSLRLGKLNAGRYSWRAFTSFNNKDFFKEGVFAIRDLSIEKQSTKANHQLMAQLAENNGGKFTLLNNFSSVLDDIQQRDDIVPIAYQSSSYHKLIDYWWLLLLIVLVFTAEWMIRRYSGGY